MSLLQATRQWGSTIVDAWDRFWFVPRQPHTLGVIRILGGWMLFYTHVVWAKDLLGFVGPTGWIPREVSLEMHRFLPFTWSHLWLSDSPLYVWTCHILALVVFLMLMVGWHSRVVSVLAFLITVSYCHRLEGALFGLDQVNAMLAMYLMVGNCGSVYSVDAWLRKRRAGQGGEPEATVSINIATRLLQLHMCVVYLFGGISKMKGTMWWDGSATWFAVANLEYQSLDMTWLAHFPWLTSLLTHVTLFWEMSYCFLVWPKQTRPIVLALAVAVHGGIALFLGMITFGVAMVIGNLVFVPPGVVKSCIESVFKRLGLTIDA